MNHLTCNTRTRLSARDCFSIAVLLVIYAGRCWAESTFIVAAETQPFSGVRYLRLEKSAPDPQVAHIVQIAMNTPGLRFTTTPSNGPDAPRETWCETTRGFVEKTGAQIGINGNYFIYDEELDTELIGLAVSDGNIVSPWDASLSRFALNITKDNKAVFVERPEDGAGNSATQPKTDLYSAVSSHPLLLRKGSIVVDEGGERHPRTGIGLTADNKLILLVVDGRQPSYSIGMTFREMAEVLLAHGAVDALALDGGGSSTLVFADPTPHVVNVPMPTALPVDVGLKPPGIERPNGNNLAIFVSPAPTIK